MPRWCQAWVLLGYMLRRRKRRGCVLGDTQREAHFGSTKLSPKSKQWDLMCARLRPELALSCYLQEGSPPRVQARRRGSPALPGAVSETKLLTEARAPVACIQPYLTSA